MIAAGTVVLVLLVSVGAYLAYENTLPTTAASSIPNGKKDVPTDAKFVVTFSRAVPLAAVQQALTVSPATEGTITAVSGQTVYAWTPAKPLTELTTYTLSLKPIYDVGHHRVNAAQWTFTTIIVPRVTAITTADGTALKDGMELDFGAALKLTFNDVMDPGTVKVSIGGKPANVTWASDSRSATFSTSGLPSGPLVVSLAGGGRDVTGHLMPAAFTLNTGIYWHDHEHTIALNYPALIQIPNDEFAVDQNGLQAADIVYEYLAEGGITRLTAIYQRAPDLIGPMRSARFISLKLGRHYRGLLFQSGESAATRARAAQDPTPQFFDTIGYQFRTGSRDAPDNLMIHGDRVLAAEGLYGIQTWQFPKTRPNLGGGSGASSINVEEHYSVYTYDASTGTYQKSELDHHYQDASLHQPLRIEMLVVLHTQEQLLDVGDGHGAHIHDFNLDTSGPAEIYYKGLGYSGTWASTDSHGPLTFSVGGQPVTLPPGLVWIDVVSV